LEAATRARKDEKTAYESNKADDEAAQGLIENAMKVLETFYSDNFGLLQVQDGARQPPVVEAGKAPPPPPPTWSEDYGGAQGESKGIQGILGMILDDVKADIKKSTEAEEAAVKAFEQLKEDTEGAIKAANQAIEDLKGDIADSEQTITDETSDKQDNKKSLDATLKEIESAEPGCNFIGINLEVRTRNRQLEIDGLLKAKTILEGGAFTPPEDPNREIKPGDAL